ncbi:MAG: nitroreductase family protein [Eubacteriales bacterium]|jgi:nitroreductase
MLYDLVMKNRSYRSFDESRKITREELLGFVDIARRTPSARNRQPLCYRLVHTKEECDTLLPLTGWAALVNVKLPPEGHAPTAYIVICCDTTVEPDTTRALRDVGICAQTIMLAATEAGLGGCMIGSFTPEKVSAALKIPEKYRPILVLALGKPDEKVQLIEAVDGNVAYYREGGVHYVPKRTLEDIIIK